MTSEINNLTAKKGKGEAEKDESMSVDTSLQGIPEEKSSLPEKSVSDYKPSETSPDPEEK